MIMGTGVSLDIPGAASEAIFEKVFARLAEIDERFSTYKSQSEVSRFQRGELTEKTASRELKKIIRACQDAEELTHGYFSAYATGKFDPSGYVKSWAIAEAGKLIKKAGYDTFCIGVGGDILAASDGDKLWRIGIQDPSDKSGIIATVSATNLAAATSGNYERGAHIYSPKTGQPADAILSITVVGPDIVDADVLATAAFVQGEFGINYIGGEAKGYEALMVKKNGELAMTRGLPPLLL